MPQYVYGCDRRGRVVILDPTTCLPVGGDYYHTAPGPALFGLGFDVSNNNVYFAGIPDGSGIDDPAASGSVFYSIRMAPGPVQVALPSQMPLGSIEPYAMAVDSSHGRVFVADPLVGLTAWSTTPGASGFPQLAGSPYTPGLGQIKAKGVAYSAALNRVYVCCQNAAGVDQVAVYDANSGPPMNQIPGSPFTIAATHPLSLTTSRTSMAIDTTQTPNRVLITCPSGVVALNGSTLAVIGTGPYPTSATQSGATPRGITLDSAGRVYICNFGQDTLAVLTAGTYAPIASSPFPTGHGPQAVIYNPTTNYVYVANFNGGDLNGVAGRGGLSVHLASTMAQISGSPFQPDNPLTNLTFGP